MTSLPGAAHGSHPGKAPWTLRRSSITYLAVGAVAVPLYVLFPTAVGLNGDLSRYGMAGVNLLCGAAKPVWGNYRVEPLFVAVLYVFSWTWDAIGGVANCVNPGPAVFWLPIFMSSVLIMVLIFVVRHLGLWAICFHVAFCFDTVLMMLPFNLLRQFVAVVLIMTMIPLMMSRRISPAVFVVGLICAALVHWSAWLLVLAGLAAIALVEIPNLRHRKVKSSLALAVGMVIAAVAAVVGAYLFAAYAMPRFQLAVAGPGGIQWSLESSVRGLISPITLSVIAIAIAIWMSGRVGFVGVFVAVSAVLYFVAAVSGHVAAMERLRALVLPSIYFVFLTLLHEGTIKARWHLFNLLFMMWAVFNVSWHAVVTRPFKDRPSFTELAR